MSMFQQRHYEAIALVLQHAYENAESNPHQNLAIEGISEELVNVFARDNPRFDRDRFIRACESGANVRARA